MVVLNVVGTDVVLTPSAEEPNAILDVCHAGVDEVPKS